mmetsp:Transcript_50076/g.108526  ORF Transcript_50076/g.108526 Transcript_50076/m.108526 type:complete len:301 (+) Transcript_50076:775-1677(+)
MSSNSSTSSTCISTARATLSAIALSVAARRRSPINLNCRDRTQQFVISNDPKLVLRRENVLPRPSPVLQLPHARRVTLVQPDLVQTGARVERDNPPRSAVERPGARRHQLHAPEHQLMRHLADLSWPGTALGARRRSKFLRGRRFLRGRSFLRGLGNRRALARPTDIRHFGLDEIRLCGGRVSVGSLHSSSRDIGNESVGSPTLVGVGISISIGIGIGIGFIISICMSISVGISTSRAIGSGTRARIRLRIGHEPVRLLLLLPFTPGGFGVRVSSKLRRNLRRCLSFTRGHYCCSLRHAR